MREDTVSMYNEIKQRNKQIPLWKGDWNLKCSELLYKELRYKDLFMKSLDIWK